MNRSQPLDAGRAERRPEVSLELTRRALFGRGAGGLGIAALATLLQRDAAAGSENAARSRFGGLPGVPHFTPKARRVIYLLQNGAPTHVDLFDYKPKLKRQFRALLHPAGAQG